MPRAKLFSITIVVLVLCLFPVLSDAHQVMPTDSAKDYGRFTETPPPTGPVRPIAEFEPATQVLIRYPLGIPVSLVVHLANTAQVVCIVASSSVQSQAISAFTSAGVNMSSVTFLIAATDSYWTRDFGPWFIFDGNGNYGLVDFQYNRPRPNDNLIPQVFATNFGLTYYGMNLQQTGGNYMSDGINSVAQTNIAYTENSGQGQTGVNTKMLSYMGASNYFVRPDPNNTYIDHIDCWAKFLAPDKVLVRSVPSSHAQYNAIEQAAAFFANQNCAWGYPYKVYRVNTPNNQPYTNSLILNKKVFVPIMNSQYDAAALQVYRDAMPGYEVIGILNTTSNVWESTDALHCRTHEIPDQGMLHIAHQPYWGILPSADVLEFNATIRAHSGQALYSDSTYVRYQINQGAWQTALLASSSGSNYSTTLSGFAMGDTIRYFIHSADQSGRATSHPYFAELDPHVFRIAADTEAPVILFGDVPAEITSGEHLFSVTVSDNVSVNRVVLRYRIDDGNPVEIDMMTDSEAPPDNWYQTIDLDFVSGQDTFYFQIEAWDNANPPNITYYPWEGEWISVPITGVANNDNIESPTVAAIDAVFPNPFSLSASTELTVKYSNPTNTPLELNIFNIKGQLMHSDILPSTTSGEGKATWSGFGVKNTTVPPGIYFIQLQGCGISLNTKVLILK